jgi:hypothetical protein
MLCCAQICDAAAVQSPGSFKNVTAFVHSRTLCAYEHAMWAVGNTCWLPVCTRPLSPAQSSNMLLHVHVWAKPDISLRSQHIILGVPSALVPRAAVSAAGARSVTVAAPFCAPCSSSHVSEYAINSFYRNLLMRAVQPGLLACAATRSECKLTWYACRKFATDATDVARCLSWCWVIALL